MINIDQEEFEAEKKALRQAYKLYKAGLLKERDISPRVRRLLVKYYGVRFDYHAVRGAK